jgi:large subunit ribosomal protein L3
VAEKETKTEEAIPFARAKLLGRKVGMTQIYGEDGRAVPVTVILAGPCEVVQVKTKERDGYDALQLGFEERKKGVKKPQLENFKKLGISPKRFLREVRLARSAQNITTGTKLTVQIFEKTQKVDVSGISKGRGFAGMVKRWHKERGPETHGSMNVRQPGSIGASASPSRVFKGKHMPGHMGAKRCTVRNLKVVKVDPEKNILLVKGAVPGPNGQFVEIQESLRTK